MTASLAWFDTHCHLQDPEYDADRSEVVARAQSVGVTRLVTIGTGLANSKQAIGLAEGSENVWATVGIHPHEASGWDAKAQEELQALSENSRVVAIGEVGLDYHYEHSSKEAQQEAFRQSLGLAKERKLPVVIHCRDAWEDLFGILREVSTPQAGGVLHCFTGGVDELKTGLGLGLTISFSGILTFKNARAIQEAAKVAPLDRVVIETDAPYLAPDPNRGKRNEPGWVIEVGKRLADIQQRDISEVAQVTTENANRLFQLPKQKGSSGS